jgi:hypothetical protein
MIDMDTVHSIDQDLVQRQSLVAVFSGGSGGIGALSLKALASTAGKVDGKDLRAYIIGRSASAAQETIMECQVFCPKGQYHFIKIEDYALINNVDAACEELVKAETQNAALANEPVRIDYLMLSHGGALFLPKKGLSEFDTVSQPALMKSYRHERRHRRNHVSLLLQPHGLHHKAPTTSPRILTTSDSSVRLRRRHGSKTVRPGPLTPTALPL